MKYRVRVLELAGKGKKVHKSQDIIDAEALEERNIPELIKNGFIAEVPEKGDNAPPPDPNVKREYNDITANEIEAWLEAKEIIFEPTAKKPALYKLYEDNF